VAHVEPLRALHYDLARVGGLDAVAAPPYDVIDPAQRAALAARSPYNVVALDLPEGDYAHAAALLERWRADGVVVRDPEPALWALEQDYTGPDGRPRTRRGVLARVRIEPYGAGRVRPHERTHPGPREDRLRLTRATKANLSPIFMLHDDPRERVAAALAPHTREAPDAEHTLTDADGTRHRLWRIPDPDAHAAVRDALAPGELLIADGHHRYETARVYADEIGGEGAHRLVLACLVSLQDPGLTVFPTHRLLTGLDDERRAALRDALLRDFDMTETTLEDLVPAPNGRVRMGYLDAFHRRPLALTLRDPETAADALPGRSPAYRALDTAVLEALVLQRALAMSEEDIAHLAGLDYARSDAEARDRVLAGDVQAAFFMAPTPVAQVRDVAAAGETMPPKSTYFFPKVPTGLVFHALA
jgi:uncharacterized protein (DUF1015 family)